MPRDAEGNPRSGRARAKYADEAHKGTKTEERKDEKEINGGEGKGATEMKGKKEKAPDKKMADSEDRAAERNDGGEGSEDDGDIADVTEMHGPAHEISMKMDHETGKHTVESMHGEKRHKKTYGDPMEAMRHAHVAAGMGEPQAQPQQAQGGPQSTLDMLQQMGQGGGGGGIPGLS